MKEYGFVFYDVMYDKTSAHIIIQVVLTLLDLMVT